MTAEAAAVLEQIHNLEASLDLDSLIRQEVAARRKPAAKSASQRTCKACGAKNPARNKFCAECGARLDS